MSPGRTKPLATVEKRNGFFPAGCSQLSRFPCLTPVCSPGGSGFAHLMEVLQETKQEDLALGLSEEAGAGNPALGCVSIVVTPE